MDQRQRNNFYKSISGIGIATQSACHVFEQYLISNGQSLEDFINLHRHDICHLCYNKVRCPHCTTGYHLPYEKVLCTDQLNDLFDSGLKLPCHAFGNLPKFYCCESRMGIQIKDLDLTLIRCLLVNFCQDLFWINCLNGGIFEDFLNNNKHDIFHMWQVNKQCCQCPAGYTYSCDKRKLSEHEWKILFKNPITPCNFHIQFPSPNSCSLAASSGIVWQQLNKTIRLTLLDFCELKKDLEKLIKLRNNIQGHRAAREMTHMVDAEFNDIWKEIEDVICNLITHGIHDTSVATQIKDEQTKELVSLKNKILDELEEKRRQRIAFTELEIERQMKRNNFVKTRAVDEAIKIMESQNMVVLTGSAGSGKSATAIYLLRHFQTNKNYKPLKILTFADLSILINPNSDEPVIVLLEDIFGRTNYTYVENSERNVLGELGTCIGNTLKVIITIRTTIMKSCMSLFYTSNVFCGLHVVDLSRDFQLVKTEKKRLLERYLELNNITISECGNCMGDQLQPDAAVTISNKVIDEIVHLDTVGGFPENCRLFTTIRCFTRLGINFFRHPTISLRNEIDALRRADGNDNISTKLKYKFTALVYMLLSNDVLSKDSLDFCKVQDIFKSVNGGCTIIEHLLIDAADDMIDQYLTYSSIENAYYFQHRIIAEAVMISYSKCNISQVISMLNPDFIAEMVKPARYIEKEGEVVFKIPSNNYRHLANVIRQLLLLKAIGGCFIEYILTKSEIFEDVEFLYVFVETFESLFEPEDSLSFKDVELKERFCKLLDLTLKKTASLKNVDCLHFIWKLFAKKCKTIPSFVYPMCRVFVKLDKEKNRKELLDWMLLNSNQMFIEQWLEQAGDYKSCFLETLVGDNALIRKLNDALYSPGKRNIQQIIVNQACQIGNEEIVLMMMKKYDNDINLEETFLKACCNDDDEVTIVEWLLSQYNLNRLNIKKAFENICEFWNIYKNILKTLLKTSANDDNELTNKLLFAAFKTENTESASFIIHRIDLRTFDFRTAVSIACNNHAYKIIEWLLEQSFFMLISSQIDDKPILRIIKWSNKPQPCDIIAVLKDSFKAGDYGMDLMTDRIKYSKNLALIAFRFIAKSSNEIQQLFVKSCHRTHFKIEGVFLHACKSKEFEVLEMVLNIYDECIYSPLITKAGEDFLGIDIDKVSRFSKLPSVIFQNTPDSIIHYNVDLFPLAVKAGDIEKLKIFIRQVDYSKLKNHDKAFRNSIDLGTLQMTELLLDSFPMSAFEIIEHLEKVIQTGKTEFFELILRTVDIHLLDIDQLLTVVIRYGQRKGLLLDILQRIFSQLNFKIYLEKQIVSALAVMDLEVFEFVLQHVHHENIYAKRIVMEALQMDKFDIALLILGTVSVNILEMEKEVVDELVTAILCNDGNYLRRFLMSCLNVNFDKIMISAAKDGDVSIINDILCHHYAGIAIDITECIDIAFQHKQPIVIKSLIEHTKWNLDLKLELVGFVERGKTRICELYLKLINIQNSKIVDILPEIYLDFRSCFVDDHMEHQYLSRLHLPDLLTLYDLFNFACSVHDNEFIAMFLINVSEDAVDMLMTSTDERYFTSNNIFAYACSECKDGKLFNAKRLSFAKKYGCLLNDTVSDEKA